MSDTDFFYMREAIQLAEQGMRRGDGGPFGAVIVREGKIIGSGWNRVLKTNDPTAHAEIVAIRAACAQAGSYWLEGCRIYVNCEPCPMCLAAIYWARIASLTFAATRADAAAVDFDDAFIYGEVCRPITERAIETHQCLREEALQVMRLWPDLETKKNY
ncbi:MAG: nucleoside deaminase [Desulfobulbaceae bacterium]|nr:nucleoside deaminase [Desulfobulbaceae bacterium]